MWFDEDINLVIETDPFINVSGTTSFSQINNVIVDSVEQPIIIETPQYYAPVQSVNGKIGFVTITQEDLGISGGLVSFGDLTTYSGYVDNKYATIINLATTGSTLQNNIDTLASNLATTGYTLASNLATTGSTLESNLATTGSTLASNLATTGSTLASNLATTGYTLASNLATTGSTLESNLATTGLTLQTELRGLNISSLIGNINNNILVANPNFSDTSGMVFNGFDWYGGNVPFWSGPTNPNFEVYFDGTFYYNNLNAGPKGSGVNALRQQISNTSPIISDIRLEFYNANVAALGGLFTINAAIYTTDYKVLSSGSFPSVGYNELIAKNIPPNINYIIAFWGSPQGAIRDIKINQSGIGQSLNIQSPYLLINSISGDGGIFFVTGSGLTGVNDYGPIIGFDRGNKLKFGIARRSDDLSILNDIASVQDLTNYSGIVDNKYATISNLATTGSTLQSNINTNVSNLVTTGETLNAKINSLSGSSVLIYGNQNISGIKYFNDQVYIHDLYVTGTEFIANVQNNFIESSYILLNLTGGAIDGGVFFVTGTGLTGVNDYGPIIGFDHSNKFKFGIARRSDDLSSLNDIAAFQDITNYSGIVDSTYSKIGHTHPASDINNSSSEGRGLLTGNRQFQRESLSLFPAYNNYADLTGNGPKQTSRIYVTTNNWRIYAWVPSLDQYVEVSPTPTGELDNRYASITNLALTGSTLNTKINNLSGYITGEILPNYYTKTDLTGFYTGSIENNWTLKRSFTGSSYDYYNGDQIISKDGNVLILGSTIDSDGGSNAGAISIYTGANNIWNFKQKITGAAGSGIGYSIEINKNKDTIFVAGNNLVNIYTGDTTGGWYYKQNIATGLPLGRTHISEDGSIFTIDYGSLLPGGILIYTGNKNSNWILKQQIGLTSSYQGNPGHSINKDGSIIISNGAPSNSTLTILTGNAQNGWSTYINPPNPPRSYVGTETYINQDGTTIYNIASDRIIYIYTGNIYNNLPFAFDTSITGSNFGTGKFSYITSSSDDKSLFVSDMEDDVGAQNNGSISIFKNTILGWNLYQKVISNISRLERKFGNGLSIVDNGSILVTRNSIDPFFTLNTGIVQIYSLDPNSPQFTFKDDVIIDRNLYVKNRPLINGTGVLLSGEAYLNSNPSGFITGVSLNDIRFLNKSFKNIYISSQIGNNGTAQIGNINLPFQTAQAAWDAIPSTEFSVGQVTYIFNFYGGSTFGTSYSINLGSRNWPDHLGIRGLGPGFIDLTLTHELKAAGTDGASFSIRDWGNKSVGLTITSQGGSSAGSTSDGGNGGDIFLYNCKINSITSRGGNPSSSNRAGLCGSVYLSNCEGGSVTVQHGNGGIGLKPQVNPVTQTAINTTTTYSSDPGSITWNFQNSKIEFPSLFFSNSNRYFTNTENTRSSQQTYHFNTQILSGNRIIQNLELSSRSLLSGNVTGIVLTDNITGRNKSGYRENAFVADFASGIYLSNQVYIQDLYVSGKRVTALDMSPVTVNIANNVTVTNGNFSDTAGMTFNGFDWYGGNVPGWTGPTDSTYAVYRVGVISVSYFNNLNAGPKGSGTNALRQQVTTSLPAVSNIALRFENADIPAFGGVYTINAAIYTTGFQVLASGSFPGAGQKVLIANNVPSGTNCIIAFWGSPQGALTNVSVVQTGIYNTLRFNNELPSFSGGLPDNSLWVDNNGFLRVV